MQKFQEIFNFTREFLKIKNHQEDAGIVKVLWYVSPNQELTRVVSHYGLAICIKKYLKAKEELWKLKYFIIAKIYLKSSKNPLKETKILQDIIIL